MGDNDDDGDVCVCVCVCVCDWLLERKWGADRQRLSAVGRSD